MSRGSIFKSVRVPKVRKNVFDLSHEKKLSASMGDLIPVMCVEVLPGDKFKCTTEQVIRLAPMTAPVMHRVNSYVHYFFVPNRLVWENWEDFITAGKDGTSAPVFPYVRIDNTTGNAITVGSLADYLGVPPAPETVTYAQNVNALPFRGYQLIYNEYYRDQTLSPEVTILKTDGYQENSAILELRKRAWEKDYFCSALPFTQRGADVNIPMDIEYLNPAIAKNGAGATINSEALETYTAGEIQGATSDQYASIENIESIGATINNLRTSIRLQEFLETAARVGSRYVEQLMGYFGVNNDDLRLQRPKYLGGGKIPIQISEVLATFKNDTVPQGNLSGHGIAVGNQAGFQYTALEHGYIFAIQSTIPRTCYYQGIPRMFRKQTRFDFAFPQFAHLGEQAVFTDELYVDYTADNPQEIFGYQSRYAEYKYIQDSVHGDFRDTLEFWHMGRKFASRPLLNDSFITSDPTTRIFAVDDSGATNKLYIQLYNNLRVIRALPVYGTPML